MANPFSGIISSDFKALYNNAISSLLYNDALTLPCTLYYAATKFEDCANCVASVIGGKPSSRFQSGGPMPFSVGTRCPMCNGDGKRAVISTVSINLMVIWDSKEFISAGTVNSPEGLIQTITFDENTPKLKRAQKIVVATDKAGYGNHVYERASEPESCGFGGSEFVSCLWKRI